MRSNDGLNLLKWYKKNKRDLPWRKTKDPYLIWISEIVLQQTRIDQGLSYYMRFVKRFPNVETLANVSEDEVLKYWQGLGYYLRARNLHASAKYIHIHENDIFPSEYDQILSLKGVGSYTAAAIASIAYSQPYPVIDGNVNRVISRFFGIEKAVNTPEGAKEVKERLDSIFVKHDPGDFNQAIMELGALICKPASPNCGDCVLHKNCIARAKNKVNDFPVKVKLKAPQKMYLYFFVLKNNEEEEKAVYLNKRNKNSIWKNLYDFPSVESKTKRDIHEVITEFMQNYSLENLDSETNKFVGPINHKLTHRNIMAYFIEINVSTDFKGIGDDELIKVKYKNLKEYAVPKLIDNHIKGYLLK